MNFIISKIFSLLMNPFLWFMFLIFIGAIQRFRKKKYLKIIYTAIIILAVFSNGLPIKLAKSIYLYPKPPLCLTDSFDLAIVLGGYSGYSKANMDIEWHATSDRILYPLKWYKNGQIKKILITGGSGNIKDTLYKESDLVKRWLIEFGVSKEDIFSENMSRNTFENARYSKPITTDFTNIVLVTSAIHGRRAEAVFKKQGINAALITVDNPDLNYTFSDLRFSAENVVEWKYLLHEIIGYTVYFFRGHL